MEAPQDPVSSVGFDPARREPAHPETHTLSQGQLTALQNLASKQAGEDVSWINIADARSLTECGLADRGREGWHITAAGSAALLSMAAIGDHETDTSQLADHQPIPMIRPDQ